MLSQASSRLSVRWSHPYFASGKVVVSGIEQGLFVLDPGAAEAPVTGGTTGGDGGGGSTGGGSGGGGSTGADSGSQGGSAGGSGGSTGGSGSSSGGQGQTAAPAARPAIARRSLRSSRTRTVRVRLFSRGRAIGRRSFDIRGGRMTAVRVTLRRAAYRRLVRRSSYRTRAVVSSRGSDGVLRSASRTVRLRAPAR